MTLGVSTKDQSVNGQDFKKGDRVFVDVTSANLDVSDAIGPRYIQHRLTSSPRTRSSATPLASISAVLRKIVSIPTVYSGTWERVSQ